MTRVVHVITELTAGGAEEMLLKLLRAERAREHAEGAAQPRTATVLSLTSVGPVGARIRSLGVPVEGMGMRPGRPTPGGALRLVSRLRRFAPNLVQTWMYHSDLLGGAAAFALGIPVVWGVRHDVSQLDKRMTRLTRRLCALSSRWVPRRVVFNSASAMRAHGALGYDVRKLVVIPNGFDVRRFRPDTVARAAVRTELGVPEASPLVGLVARLHPDKDHATFLTAAAQVRERLPAARFLLCGEGIGWEQAELASTIDRHGLRPAMHLLGPREDVERVYAALDLFALSSRTESFPNVLGEAMASGLPCVATDCGDVRAILGEIGEAVPVGDAAALAEAILRQLALPAVARENAAAAARARVEREFALEAVAARFRAVQDEAAASR